MKLKVLGAAGTVTGSSYVLTADNGQSLLVDLGMFQGPKQIEQLNYETYEYDLNQLSGAILTHAHLDHSGRLPFLVQQGFKHHVWMTPPTKDLAELVLQDSAKIAEKDPDSAMYTKEEVESLVNLFKTHSFNAPFNIGQFEVTFVKAGHLLGAASVVVKDKRADGHIRTVCFSGDLGHIPEELLQNRQQVKSADVVVIESTYGDRLHTDANPYDLLQNEINAVEQSGSVLLIPSFSLEKTQELLHMIRHLKADKLVATETPIYLDSPMALQATRIYEKYSEYANPHVLKDFGKDSPYDFPGIEIIQSHQQSQTIKEVEGVKVIIAGAGMMTGGRIVGHAKEYLSNPGNRIFFVGYQGEDTLGRDILEGKKQVKINKDVVDVKAHVGRTDGMSAHADQSQLLEWLGGIEHVKKVVITHGEEPSRAALAQKIQTELGQPNIALPYLNQDLKL